MTIHKYQVGDHVVIRGDTEISAWRRGQDFTVTRLDHVGGRPYYVGDNKASSGGVYQDHIAGVFRDDHAIDPNYYVFPGGHEVRHISAHLTSFGGQAVQYIARSTRLDGQNKGDTAENLRKAIKFLEWELERIAE